MDKPDNAKKVSLPSGAQTEPQTILEKQNASLIAQIRGSDSVVEAAKSTNLSKLAGEVSSEEESEVSESDNEELNDVIEVKLPKKVDAKSVQSSIEFHRLSEDESDNEADKEIENILAKEIVPEVAKTEEVESAPAKSPAKEPIDDFELKFEEQKLPETSSPVVLPASPSSPTKETIIDEDLLPKGPIDAPLSKNTDIDTGESHLAKQEDKPPIPLQTYLWEDVKRSKEQGGYPWTHLYKDPLGPDEDPEILLKYRASPRTILLGDHGTPKSHKKVRIQEEIEIKEAEKYIRDLDSEDELDKLDSDEFEGPELKETCLDDPDEPSTSEAKAPQGILKRSQQKLYDTFKPHSSSLKKKFNNPITKIKKMADKQFKKVKPTKGIKTITIAKNEIVLEDPQKILKLKESPKSRNREITSYIVKQDSDDTVEITNLDESPTETRKKRDAEDTTVIPDEIIELPVLKEEEHQENAENLTFEKEEIMEVIEEISAEKVEKLETESDSQGSQEPTVDEILKEEMKNDPPPKNEPPPKAPRKKREHVYEDIDEYVSRISEDTENVDKTLNIRKPLDKSQFPAECFDPIFEDYVMGNENIKIKLRIQDEKFSTDLRNKHRHSELDDLEKQGSLEEREDEKTIKKQDSLDVKPMHLLAPISSIDSTSSDEANNQLSIVAEESEAESSKKKDEDVAESDDDMKDVESLDGDGSVVEVFKSEPTLIESLGSKNEDKEIVENALKLMQSEALKEDVDIKENQKIMPKWAKMSDHEYEPIGEPMEDEPIEDQQIDDPEDFNAKPSGMQLLRTPTQDSEDNISAQDFQDDIENRFFSNTTNVSSVANVATAYVEAIRVPVLHRENISQEAVIIDNASAHEESPSKKRNLMSSAQEQSKNFRKKIRTQASLIKTSINNKIKKKPKEKPVAVEVAHLPVDASQAIEVQQLTHSSVSSEPSAPTVLVTRRSTSPRQSPNKFARKGIRMPKMSRPEFTKKISAPTMPKMPKFKKISMPDRPKMPDMPKFGMQDKLASFRQLGRSKSLKETSVTTDSTSFTTPELSSTNAQPTKKKFEFDFRTYPRLLKDKFKKQKMERSDRSVRADTPPVLEFTTVSKSAVQKNRGPVASRWIDDEEESGKYRQFDDGSLDRESSVERRMRMDFDGTMDEDDAIELARRLLNEEQKQLDELDRENQEIHAGAKQAEHKQRKVVPRQESDDDHFWSGTLNKDVKDEYEELDEQQMAEFASHDENYRFSLEEIDQKGFRSSTPQTNQETQSSGSSGARRRTALLDEIDDDEFFLQRREENSENMQMGEYISEAIKEGLSSPVNALAQMGRFDNYYEREYTPEKPSRSLRRNNKKDSQEPEERGSYQDEEEVETKANFYRTYPPDRPNRKSNRKGYHEDEDDFSQEVPYLEDYLVDEVNNNQLFFGKNQEVTLTSEDIENEMDLKFQSKLPVPPTPPRRRKKRVRDITPANGVPFEEMPIELIREAEKLAKVPQAHDVIVHRVEHDIPLAEEERFTTPTPVPRRTRSRSRLSARTSGDADSLRVDSNEMLHFHRMNVDAEGTNGYAVIKKDAPPRPPAPLRRKRSTKSLGDRQFATLPHFKGDESPVRPTRNYSTITPNRPPRRKSSCSLENEPIGRSQADDDDEYEEIETNIDAHNPNRRLKSGAVISKMKDRPLPPPPRPKREPKKNKKSESDGKHDKDDDAEKIQTEKIQIVPVRQESSDQEIEEQRVIEVDMSTQTDPVPEDYECEFDEDIDLEQYIRDGKLKSLEEILKEEQEAEIERHRQLAEAENLSRGIQRFRESSQRSFSEKSGRSDRPKTPISRPLTPSAILVERKKSSPIMFNNENEMVTEAVLFVHPIQMEESVLEREIRQEEIALQNALRIEREEILEREAERVLILELEAEKIQNVERVTRKLSYETTDDKLQNVEPEDLKLQNLEEEILRNIESEIEIQHVQTVREPESVKLLNTDSQEAFNQPEISVPLSQDYQNFPPEVTFEETAVDRLESDIIRQIDEMVEQIVSTAQDQAEDLRGSNTQINFEDLLEDQPLPTPIAPPRKKSTPLDTLETETPLNSTLVDLPNITNAADTEQILSDDEPAMERDTEDTEVQSNLPTSRLHISSLEIDVLSVSSLTAGRITVSELDSHSITTNEFDCKSDSRTMEIPPGLIDEIVERVRSSERESRQLEQQIKEQVDAQKAENAVKDNKNVGSQEPKEDAPARPPPPQMPPFVYGEYQGYSMVPPSFYQLRNYSDEELAAPQTPHRRRRHVRRRDSTSEEEFQREQKVRSRQGTRSPEPSVSASGGQFARACGSALQRSGSNLMAILRAASKDENRRDLHIALLILVIIVAGLMMFGVGDTAVHHHHWDYFNPPDNPSRS